MGFTTRVPNLTVHRLLIGEASTLTEVHTHSAEL